jgi:hypothetical protein
VTAEGMAGGKEEKKRLLVHYTKYTLMSMISKIIVRILEGLKAISLAATA